MLWLARPVLIYLLAASLLSALVAAYDKLAAKRLPQHRIRESTLLLLAVAGGAPGMLFMMLVIRHKTKHRFMIAFITVFTLLYAAFAALLVNLLYRAGLFIWR